MSLLLNGSKTLAIAGSELQCLEIYSGESYSMPLEFKTSNNVAIDCTGWSLSTSAKYYRGTITYPSAKSVQVSNLTLINPQPSTGGGTYSADMTAAFTSASTGLGYLYIPSNLANGTGGAVKTPSPELTDTDSIIVIVTLTITRVDVDSARTVVSREPLGFIVRYQ